MKSTHLTPVIIAFLLGIGQASAARPSLNLESISRNGEPLQIRKMTPDEGEKFFPEYWLFANISSSCSSSIPRQSGPQSSQSAIEDISEAATKDKREKEEEEEEINKSNIRPRIYPLNPPKTPTPQNAALLLRTLFARTFTCPPNTSPCTSINRPSSCCGLDETCELVNSEVGCCPAGQSCAGGSVGECGGGYTSCGVDFGGGCCIDGYECVDGGCMFFLFLFSSILFSPTRYNTQGKKETRKTETKKKKNQS